MVYRVFADSVSPKNAVVTYTPPILCRLMGGMMNNVSVVAPTRLGFPFLPKGQDLMGPGQKSLVCRHHGQGRWPPGTRSGRTELYRAGAESTVGR